MCELDGPPVLLSEGFQPAPVYPDGIAAEVVGTFGARLKAMFAPTRWQYVLLGREDFFSQFRITLDQRALTTTLEPYGEAMDG